MSKSQAPPQPAEQEQILAISAQREKHARLLRVALKVAIGFFVGVTLLLVALIIPSTGPLPSGLARGVGIAGFAVLGLTLVGVIVTAVLGASASAAIHKIGATHDLAVAPVAALRHGAKFDRLIVVPGKPGSLHLARHESWRTLLAIKWGAAIGGAGLILALVASCILLFTGATKLSSVLKSFKLGGGMLFGGSFGIIWAFRHTTVQWFIETDTRDKLLVVVELISITGRRLKELPASEVRGFVFADGKLGLLTASGERCVLAHVGKGTLAAWEAACLASELTAALELNVSALQLADRNLALELPRPQGEYDLTDRGVVAWERTPAPRAAS
jgi:hypothetical protein